MVIYRRLGVLALAQVAVLVLVLTAIDGDWQPPAAQTPAVPAPPVAGADAAAGADRVVDVAARPLFLAGRRPPEPTAAPPAEEAAAPDALADVSLVGVYGAGSEAGALLRKGTEVSRLRPSGEWQGWRLLALGATEVTLIAADGATRTLKLERRPQLGGMVAQPAGGADGGKAADRKKAGAQRANATNGAHQAGGSNGVAAERQAALRAARERAARINSSD